MGDSYRIKLRLLRLLSKTLLSFTDTSEVGRLIYILQNLRVIVSRQILFQLNRLFTQTKQCRSGEGNFTSIESSLLTRINIFKGCI